MIGPLKWVSHSCLYGISKIRREAPLGTVSAPLCAEGDRRNPRRVAMPRADTPTVFVIDDDARIRASMQGLLKSVGLHAECFETAEQSLERKPGDGPRCIILDVNHPGISGINFQQHLKKAGLQIPIIFLRAHGDI